MHTFYITTPIYYVNDKPHIGHAYTSLACDTVARFYRLLGYQVRFVTGTDEHGQKIEKAALKAQKNPQSFVDEVAETFIDLAKKLDLSHDDFIRTTQKRHKVAAQHLWQNMMANGFIYKDQYSGWYATRDECFYSEDELIGGKAPTGAEVEWVSEESYFFKLSAFTQPLLDFYRKNPEAIQPASRYNEVVKFIESGLKDLSISRNSVAWGIQVPNDNQHVMYVWVDALSNYLTALNYPENDMAENAFWQNVNHVVGKDILRFHSVFWPSFLMAANIPLPKKVFAHGWWTVDGEKMSKSLGNAINPITLIEKYSVDALRYYMLKSLNFGSDGDFSETRLVSTINSDLANAFGNLCQRVIKFALKNYDGKITKPIKLLDSDKDFLNSFQKIVNNLPDYLINYRLQKICEELWQVIYNANAYVDQKKPWDLFKTDPQQCQDVLWVLCELLRRLGILLQPLLPEASKKLLSSLGTEINARDITALQTTKKQYALQEIQPLFMRI